MKDGNVGKTSGEKGSKQKREIGSEVRERKGDRKQDRMRGNKARTTDNWENNERKDGERLNDRKEIRGKEEEQEKENRK